LNRNWNRSQMSGEVQPPHEPKNSDKHNQRSSKRWALLMITEESSWQSSMRNKCDSSVLSWLDCAGKCTKTDLTCSGMGHSFCTKMHASTWGRLWPICLVNMSRKCYIMHHTV
jgi:hypothetical protein